MAYHEIHTERDLFYYFEKGDNTYADPHFHSASEFVFVEKGDLAATVDGVKRVLHSGEACFCPEFSIHTYNRSYGTKTFVLLSKKKYTDRLLEIFKKKQPPTFFKFDDFQMLEYFHELIHRDYRSEEIRQGIIEGFLQVLYYKIASECDFVSKNVVTQSNLVCEILKYASENYNMPMSLNVLSKRFGYTRESLSRILHKHLSESWSTYINRLRIYEANRMLLEYPEKTVLEIVYACGFNSSNTFYRTYLKEFGYPPRKQPEEVTRAFPNARHRK